MRKQKSVLSGLMLLGAMSISEGAMAACDACWGAVGLKQWKSTISAEGLASSSADSTMVSLTGGYGSMYLNFGFQYEDPKYKYSPFGNAGIYHHGSSSVNLGYLVTPEFSVVVGLRNVLDKFESPPNVIIRPAGEYEFTTVGGAYNHKFEDSPFSINALVSIGKATLKAKSCLPSAPCVGTTSAPSTFLNYELGANYALTESAKLGLFYRIEEWTALLPDTFVNPPTSINLTAKKIKLGGLGVGFSYAF